MASSPPWDYIAKLVCIGDSGCGKSSLTIRLCEGRFVAHHDVTIGVEFGSRIVPVGPPHSNPKSEFESNSNAQQQQPQSQQQIQSQQNALKSSHTSPNHNHNHNHKDARDKDKETPPPVQKHMKLSLWDTAGQETYKSVTRSYFRGASGALLVFDLSRRATFQHVTDWLNDLRQIAEADIVVVLVGNKADLTQSSSSSTSNGSRDGGEQEETVENKREVTRAEAEEWARRNGVLEYVETSAKSGEGVERAFMRVAERIYQNIQAGRYDLNDRRSGVKGPAAAGGGGSNGARQQIRLGQEGSSKSGVVGGCC